MERLPYETIDMVAEYLDNRSLSSFSSSCTRLHQVLLARLYCTLNIIYEDSGADLASLKLIRTLQESQTCRGLLRNIEISRPPPQQWVWEPMFRPLCLAVTGMLQSLPQSTLVSFIWKLRCLRNPDVLRHVPRCITRLHLETEIIDHSALFPVLRELSCNQLSTLEDIAWVSWHIRRRSLRKLCLGLVNTRVDPDRVFELLAYPQASLASLTHLTLERMDVSQWPFEVMGSLECLNLKHCFQVDMALGSILRGCDRQLILRDLSISMLGEPSSLVAFLSELSKTVRLETLRICTAGGRDRLPSSCVLMFQESLRHLELESRLNPTDVRSVYLYSIEDIAQITAHCRRLTTLSVPINIGKDDRRSWVCTRWHSSAHKAHLSLVCLFDS